MATNIVYIWIIRFITAEPFRWQEIITFLQYSLIWYLLIIVILNVKQYLKEKEKRMAEITPTTYSDIENLSYKYKEATISELELRWDKNIADNINDERWVAWKAQSVEDNKNGKYKTFVVLYNDEPIGEGTLIFSSPYPEVNALRIDKQYEGKGHISKLIKVMESYAKKAGYASIKIGVEPAETRNLGMYLHWGYDTFIESKTSDIEEEGLLLYYSKKL